MKLIIRSNASNKYIVISTILFKRIKNSKCKSQEEISAQNNSQNGSQI